MNFWEFYAMHPVGYSLLLIILFSIVCNTIEEFAKRKRR